MRLSKVYVRFFRSFNYDFVRKADPKATPETWEMLGEAWFPFIVVDLEEGGVRLGLAPAQRRGAGNRAGGARTMVFHDAPPADGR